MMQTLYQPTGHSRNASCPSSQATWFKQSKPLGTAIADRGIKVTVKPNPADSWAAFDYELPLGMAKATLTLSDAQGKLIQTIDLGQNKGQWIWDTRMAGNGVYYYRLQAGGLQVTGKLVVK